MTTWWRFYSDAINDPKLLRLSDELFRAWTTLLCLASKNGGVLPPADDIALTLRMKPAKVAEWITKLVSSKLLDKTETGFVPHNWDVRQYKSDVSTARVQRYRNAKRNVSSKVTSAVSETASDTEQIQSRAEQTRDVSIEADLAKAIVKAFEAANSPNLPDTSRVGLWITQGYDPAIILAVVTDIVRKKPSLQSLNYFDNAIKEAHAVKVPKRIEVEPSQKLSHEDALKLFSRTGVWSKHAPCPEPGHTGCTVPPELFEKYGFLPDGRKMATN